MTDTPTTMWTVLANSEEQYGLHPADLAIPEGWQAVGFTGSEEECIRHVDAVWTDMRPLSLRAALGSPAS
ncbi:MbtH family NRPS accessory protein [Streptomyces sp. NPDC000151]|uniref:MbtH family protein n=1 Tax=Streptomyces sp. NPDC000151 TaxID=3154244 RepID=UPI00332F1DEE